MRRAVWLVAALLGALLSAAGPARADRAPVDPGAKDVADLVNAKKAELHRCWEKAAADDFRLEGTVTLRLAFKKSGQAEKVEVVADDAGDAVLTDCLVTAARRWTLSAGAEPITVELPFRFAAPDAQYTVRAEDAPVRQPKGGKLEARILIDRESAAADRASLLLLSLKTKTEIPLHRHTSAEVVYVLEGTARVKGLAGGKGESVGPGDAVYLAPGVAHSILSTAPKRKATTLLVLYAPGGVERPFKEPGAGKGVTAAVSPEERARPDPAAPQPRVARADAPTALPVMGGKGTVKILFDKDAAADGAAYVGRMHLGPGAAAPEHAHAAEAELLYLVTGAGELAVAGQPEPLPVAAGMAVYLPPGVRHAFKTTSREPVEAVQFYTPSGPEQRFKGGK